MDDDDLEATVEACLAENAVLADDCRVGVAGSWGALAGEAVLLHRDHLGRRLTDDERRAVWARLWQRLNEMRST